MLFTSLHWCTLSVSDYECIVHVEWWPHLHFQVDHTIIAYLMNPKGEFVEYFGKNKTYDTLVYEIKEYMRKYAVFED